MSEKCGNVDFKCHYCGKEQSVLYQGATPATTQCCSCGCPVVLKKKDDEPPADNVFGSGATRSRDTEAFSWTSLPWLALIGLARLAGFGAKKYGRFNWLRGLPVHDCLEHTLTHIAMFNLGDRSEEHLLSAAWGLLVARENLLRHPEDQRAYLLDANGQIPDEMLAVLDQHAADRKAGKVPDPPSWKLDDVPQVRRILGE